MAHIKLIRIDSRLIHGQVITKWLKTAKANRIVIIDDELSQDSFMSDIYVMAAPSGIAVEIYSVQEAIRLWEKEELGDGELLVLFKDVANCYQAYQLGFPIENLQIGGLASAPGRKTVLRAISFDKQDVNRLKDMQNNGVNIILHIIPEEQKVEFKKVIEKFKF